MPEYNFIVIDCDSESGTPRNSREVLCSVGISPTSRRVPIADLVFQGQQHITAGEVYEKLNVGNRHVSRATVYNSLKLLVDSGVLRQVTVEASQVFCDSNISPHHHCFDIDSGELKVIEADQFEILGIPAPPPGKSVAGVDDVVRLKLTG